MSFRQRQRAATRQGQGVEIREFLRDIPDMIERAKERDGDFRLPPTGTEHGDEFLRYLGVTIDPKAKVPGPIVNVRSVP